MIDRSRDLATLPAHDLDARAADAQWRRLERVAAHERALERRPRWQRWTIRTYARVVEPALLIVVSGYYLVWALLHSGHWLR